jgi:hypothetical protein
MCLTVLAFAAPEASALGGSAYRCEADATWQVTLSFSGTSYADISYATASTTTGCKQVYANVEPDGDFVVANRDFGAAETHRWNLLGAGVAGNSGTFAGIATLADGPGTGTFAIVDGTTLQATLVYAATTGEAIVAEVHGTESCGEGCYRTRMVWTGTQPPAT